MSTVTIEDLQNAKTDAEALATLVNGAADENGTGLVPTRTGGDKKTLAKLEAEFEEIIAAQTIHENAAAESAALAGQALTDATEQATNAAASAAAAAAMHAYALFITGQPVPLGGYPIARSVVVGSEMTRLYAEADAATDIEIMVNGITEALLTVSGKVIVAFPFTLNAGDEITAWLTSGEPTSVWVQIDKGSL